MRGERPALCTSVSLRNNQEVALVRAGSCGVPGLRERDKTMIPGIMLRILGVSGGRKSGRGLIEYWFWAEARPRARIRN